MEGIHILANLYECKNESILLDENLLEKEIKRLIEKSGLGIVGKCFYKFKNAGVTGIFLISESHVSVHTWPEKNNSINLDIFTCNVSGNNENKAKSLFEDLKKLFSPTKIKSKVVKR
ncbi:adenosylmethionine decarboxylase [archaeon]|jgi:S-adenosylmethionine decarboxylase proenzyme|nr:adenosylmethionine decarboxylase [archaeon]|tara:strand:+ start:1829 stop:2179 length:351 start_codon:yes stop_codon:yes gene_type:complete